MRDAIRHVRQTIHNLALLARTATQHAKDDPMLLAVQTARLAPARVRHVIARVLSGGETPTLRTAMGHFIGDQPDVAREALRRSPQPRTPMGGFLAAELSAQLTLPSPVLQTHPKANARAAWNNGDIETAVRHAEAAGSAGIGYARRLRSERATMLPGFELRSRMAQLALRPEGLRAAHILTNSLPHTTSGYSLRSHAILHAQQGAGIHTLALTRIGYPVTVGKPGARLIDEVDGVRYHRILAPRLSGLPAGRLQQMVDLAIPILEEFAPTVLHTTTNYTNALVTQALARSLGVPWVYEVRGQLERTWLASRHPAQRDAAQRSERYQLLRDKETEMMIAADQVVTIGETLRDDIAERTGGQTPVTVVPNGVSDSLLDESLSPQQARARVGLSTDGFWVGSVSSLVDYEGFDLLIDAVHRLRQNGRDVRLALVGDGVSRPPLIAQAQAHGLEDYSHFPGRVPPAQTPLWHQALDIFVVPRRDLPVTRTVTPLKPIEAMAVGRPVIASAVPALTEMVSGRGVDFRVDDPGHLASAIAALMDDPEDRTKYGELGRRFARTRTWRSAGATYHAIYSMLESGK